MGGGEREGKMQVCRWGVGGDRERERERERETKCKGVEREGVGGLGDLKPPQIFMT